MVSKTRTPPAVSTVFVKALEMDMKAVKSAKVPACMRKTQENAKWAWIKSCCYFKAQRVGRWPPGWKSYAAQIASHVFADCGASRGAPPCMPEAPGWHPPFSHGWSKIPVKFLRCSCFQPYCWPDCVSDHCFVKSSAVPLRWRHWCWQQKPRSTLRPAHASTISRCHLNSLIFCSFPGPLGKHFSFFPVFGTFSEKEALPCSDRRCPLPPPNCSRTRCPKALRGTVSFFGIQYRWHFRQLLGCCGIHEVFRQHRFQSFLQQRARFHLQSSNGLNACCANLACLPFRQNESAAATTKIRQSVFTIVELPGRAADGKN